MIISQTPLRMSFVGGGTDFEDFYKQSPCQVLSTTIDKYFYIGLNYRFEGSIKISYSRTELVHNVRQIKHTLVKAALEETGIKKGVDIVSLSDLPAYKTGLGMGASSAFTVGLLNALYAFLGQNKSPSFLAEKACKVEIERAGSPIGKQDQYAAAFGGLNLTTFHSDGKVSVDPIHLTHKIKQDFQSHLILFFTNKERLANTILTRQKRNINKKFDVLKKMSNMASIFKNYLEKGEFKKIGKLLHQAWLMKKSLAQGITNPEIDKMYHLALMSGAWGGKILGAGGGGFFLVMAPLEKQASIKRALNNYQLIPFCFSDTGSKIVLKT